MKRAIKFTYLLATWITALFLFSMFATYFNDWIQSTGFFGDTPRNPDEVRYAASNIDVNHNWGSRHYWYFFLCIILWALSAIRIAIWGFWYWDEQNPANKRS